MSPLLCMWADKGLRPPQPNAKHGRAGSPSTPLSAARDCRPPVYDAKQGFCADGTAPVPPEGFVRRGGSPAVATAHWEIHFRVEVLRPRHLRLFLILNFGCDGTKRNCTPAKSVRHRSWTHQRSKGSRFRTGTPIACPHEINASICRKGSYFCTLSMTGARTGLSPSAQFF